MLAFHKAVEMGCDGIELDIQLSRDGIPVITHDENIRRVTGRSGFVKDFTFEELRCFDAGCGFDARLGVNPIPSLSEYFSYIRDYDILTNIELKNSIFRYEGLEEKAVALTRKFGVTDKVMFSSFNHHSMFLCKKLMPTVQCGLLTNCWLIAAGSYVQQSGVEFLNPHYTFLTEENMRELNENQISAQAWTVDDEEEMKRLVSLGVYSIISNRPDLFLPMKKVDK